MTDPTTGSRIRQTVIGLRDALAGAGLRATIETAQVSGQTPCAWVTAQEIPEDSWTMTGPTELLCWVYLVAGNVGTTEALDQLGGLLDKALAVLTPDGAVNTALALTLPNSPNPLPAFQVPVRVDLREEA